MSRILLIDDSSDFRKLLIERINKVIKDTEVDEYDPVSQRLPADDFPWDDYSLVLIDYDLGLGKENGLSWMMHFEEIKNMPSVIMLTAEGDSNVAVRALKLGAIDFIDKADISEEVLETTINEVFALAKKKKSLTGNHDAPLPDMLFADEESDEDEILDITSSRISTTTAQMEKYGLVVPGYDIIKEVGKGGMSTVYLAKPHEEDTQVVLKIMFTEGHEDPLALKRFMQEYTLISCLDHPHVVQIYERAFAADFAYIAMEHFPGGDLAEKLKVGLELEIAVEYIHQMCMGLVAVHELNVVHRDIKPGNILFREDGTLTITDFGAAKNLTGGSDDITVNNQIVGTPYYMSPEQVSSLQVDHRSDLYSLGIMIYQMLTNERPYTAKTIAQLMSMHLNAPIPQLPDHLYKFQPLIDGLMAKDPDERFQSANDVILGLDWIK